MVRTCRFGSDWTQCGHDSSSYPLSIINAVASVPLVNVGGYVLRPGHVATSAGRMTPSSRSLLPHESIRVLLRTGKNDEAISKLRAIIAAHPGDIAAIHLLFDAHFQKRDWQSALALAQQLTKLRPETASYQKLMISTLSNLKRYDQAIAQARSFSARHGEDVEILNILKIAHFYTGSIDEAIRCGQRVMEMRDAEMCKRGAALKLREPSGRGGRDIIAFTIWGANPIYNYGAMINLLLSKTVYPGWTCRFYFDDSVPHGTIDFLAKNGAEIIAAKEFSAVPGYFRRFLPLSDPGVNRSIVRDCDSRVSAAEANLVAHWIASGYPFHVMRDHVLHNDLILAGLWGGRALRYRRSRSVASLFQLRSDQQVRARSAHAGDDGMAANPPALSCPR